MNNLYGGGANQPNYTNYSPPTIATTYNTVPNKIPPCITTTGTGQSLFASYQSLVPTSLSTLFVSSLTGNYANIASVSTNSINLDGNILTTASGAGAELLLNGVPIATTANISSITDWSLYPAISTVNFGVSGGNNGQLINVSSINGSAFINGSAPTTWSQYPATNSVIATPGTNLRLLAPTGQKVVLQGVKPDGSDAGQLAINTDGTISFGTTLTGQLTNVSTINGLAYVSGGGGAGDTITGVNTFMTATSGTSAISATGGLASGGNVSVVANPGSLGVSGGNISLTANGGTSPLGAFGVVNITANEGTADPGTGAITTGGAINLVANSGGALANLTSKISMEAGGINSYAGVASPIGSLFGYNFIQGSLGVSLVAGSVPSGAQVPGTVYLYGGTGVVLGSDTYATRVYPYWNGLTAPPNLEINGRTTISGNAFVALNNVSTIAFDATAGGAITGVQSINGSVYPPAAGSIPPNITVSTITIGAAGTVIFSDNAGYIETGGIYALFGGDLVVSASTGNNMFLSGGSAGGAVSQSLVSLLPNGTVVINNDNSATVPITDGTGLIISTEGYSLEFPLDPTSTTAVGSIKNLAEINGLPYPPAIAPNVSDLNGLTGGLNLTSTEGTVVITPGTTDINLYVPSAPYTLSGTTAGAVITNRATGSGNPLTQNVFNVMSVITFNIPPGWTATDSVSYDGYGFFDFFANLNSYWGISYITDTFATPTNILGSTTVVGNALVYSNIQQVYIPTNIIIPPTHLSAGGTITLTFFCNPTSIGQYITVSPINTAKIGIVRD